MSISQQLELELDAALVDVFDLDDAGLTVESLTDGYGLTENGASSSFICSCSICCA